MTPRSRTITWQDPAAFAAAAHLGGLEFLREILTGALPKPPIAELLGMRMIELEAGRVVFELDAAEHLYNPLNIVHGGAMSTLLDTVMGCAVQSTLAPGIRYTTTDLQVRFVRAVTTASGTLRAEGKLVHPGRRFATAEGTVTDAAGKLVAYGGCGCLVISDSR